MDWRIMGVLGASLNDPNLIAASPAQKARFWPGGDSEDSRVQMFDEMFVLPKMGNGFQGFSRIFSYVQGDGLSWNSVATHGANPDQRRSEYVAAYLSLGAGQSVLPIEQTAATGYSATTSWPICNGKWDGVSGDPNPSYVCSEANIDAIATAHCGIAANGKPAADLASLQSGDYASVKPGPCGAMCPSECGCKTSSQQCVAAWLADVAPNDAGAAAEGGDQSGADAASGGGSGGSSGSGSGGGSAGGSGGGSGGAAASSGADGGGNANDTSGGSSSGCACAAIGSPADSLPWPLAGLLASGALGVVARGRRRPAR